MKYLSAPTLLVADEREELLRETRRHRAAAQRCDRLGWRVVDERQYLGPAHFWYSLEGEARQRVHQEVAARASALAKVQLHPVQSNYLYYGPGDSLGLHHDQSRCPYAVVALLNGDADPLCLHPELAGVRPAELAPIDDPETHQGGTKVPLQDGPLLIHGELVPHHRDPHPGEEEVTIVTFCFGLAPASPGSPS